MTKFMMVLTCGFMFAFFGFFMTMPAWIDIDYLKSAIYIIEEGQGHLFWFWSILVIAGYLMVLLAFVYHKKKS